MPVMDTTLGLLLGALAVALAAPVAMRACRIDWLQVIEPGSGADG
jgi:hypothetical protein